MIKLYSYGDKQSMWIPEWKQEGWNEAYRLIVIVIERQPSS